MEADMPSPQPDVDLDEDEALSEDSVDVEVVLEMHLDEGNLSYLCRNTDKSEEIYDRSDLMDGGRQQALVLSFERRNPPPWDEICSHCEGEGCEECECPDCERHCRHICGVNYGCERHPVV
jgi:hypothetical protein